MAVQDDTANNQGSEGGNSERYRTFQDRTKLHPPKRYNDYVASALTVGLEPDTENITVEEAKKHPQ